MLDKEPDVVFVCANCKKLKPKEHSLAKCEHCGCVEVDGMNPLEVVKDVRRAFVQDQRQHGAI